MVQYLPSRATPTICIHGPRSLPKLMRRPTASSEGFAPGKKRRASVSLTTTTRGAFWSSASVKPRPARRGMPIVLK